MHTIVHLTPEMFTSKEIALVESGSLRASAFRFQSGVCGLRLTSPHGELVLLPFQGQQIWSARLGGRDLTMRSMFSQPNPTQIYLQNYGGFLLHCGATAMGVPTAADSHPLHGELPNAPYTEAWVEVGETDGERWIALSGRYQHTVAFAANYQFIPQVRLLENSASAKIHLELTNLKKTAMEWMYLAHINFRPENLSRLVYTAQPSPKTVRVRKSIPSHVRTGPEYAPFLAELEEHPEKHHVLLPDLAFDPEVVFTIDYLTDANGWAHTMQVHPDGSADYVQHRPAQLNKGVRWICRTPDQDALGMVLPATSEPEGYTAEKQKGNIKTLKAGETATMDYVVGVYTAEEAKAAEERINRIISTGEGE